jgi:hypothetical protein
MEKTKTSSKSIAAVLAVMAVGLVLASDTSLNSLCHILNLHTQQGHHNSSHLINIPHI